MAGGSCGQSESTRVWKEPWAEYLEVGPTSVTLGQFFQLLSPRASVLSALPVIASLGSEGSMASPMPELNRHCVTPASPQTHKADVDIDSQRG